MIKSKCSCNGLYLEIESMSRVLSPFSHVAKWSEIDAMIPNRIGLKKIVLKPFRTPEGVPIFPVFR